MNDALKRKIIREWLNGEFREALKDDARVKQSAAMIAVGLDNGDTPARALAIAIADFVRRVVEPEAYAPDGVRYPSPEDN